MGTQCAKCIVFFFLRNYNAHIKGCNAFIKKVEKEKRIRVTGRKCYDRKRSIFRGQRKI